MSVYGGLTLNERVYLIFLYQFFVCLLVKIEYLAAVAGLCVGLSLISLY